MTVGPLVFKVGMSSCGCHFLSHTDFPVLICLYNDSEIVEFSIKCLISIKLIRGALSFFCYVQYRVTKRVTNDQISI